jgi:hypothetical protein
MVGALDEQIGRLANRPKLQVHLGGVWLELHDEPRPVYALPRGVALSLTKAADPFIATVGRTRDSVGPQADAGGCADAADVQRAADLADVRRRAEHWSRVTAGERIHGTTRQQPRIVFEVEELPALKPMSSEPYDVPIFSSAKVGRDQHFSFKKALYSMPRHYVGRRVKLRADCNLVKIWVDGEFVRAVARQPPGTVNTVLEDIDEPLRPLVTRDASSLQALAEAAGPSVGTYTQRLLDDPRPWIRMRFVYRLLHLIKRYGAQPVDDACALALSLDVIDVIRIERIVENATEQTPPKPPAQPAPATAPRFARTKDHFAARRHTPRNSP